MLFVVIYLLMRRHNSTIKVKTRACKSCGKDSFIFSRGRCADCARVEDNQDLDEGEDGEDLSGLIQDADTIFSKWVRYKDADKEGNNSCYTCGVVLPASKLQAGHYINRIHAYTRHLPANVKPQCESCNCFKRGNLAEYGKRLEQETPGVTEFLLEQSRTVYKFSREELRTVINDYSRKLESLIYIKP